MTPTEYEAAVAATTACASDVARAEGYSEPRAAWGQCVIATDRIVDTLKGVPTWCIRVTGLDYSGREHWAALVPNLTPVDGEAALPDEAAMTGTVVDVTCRQFDDGAPVVFVGTVDDWLDSCCEWLVDGVAVEVYRDWRDSGHNGDVVWRDVHVRDDIEPDALVYPWQREEQLTAAR